MNEIIRGEKKSLVQDKISIIANREKQERKPTVLLHSCCGPCSTAVVEQLIRDYDVTIFFYNPNISDRAEYLKRKETQENFIAKYNMNPDRLALLHYKEGSYDPDRFCSCVKGFENEREGGRRCSICFKLRLEETADKAMIGGFDYFTTTLSVSPHKNFELISKIGNELSMRSGLPFLAQNFKKKDGYKFSIELSKKYGLYRQNYCGCEFSK